MSFLSFLFPNRSNETKKKPILTLKPQTTLHDSLLDMPIPSTKKELEELEIKIALAMSEANAEICKARKDLVIKKEAINEMRLLSNKLMEVIHKQNEIKNQERTE